MQIIHLDAEKRKMILTHKPTLLKSELPLITSYEEAQEGVVSHGWISGVRVRIRHPVYCAYVCVLPVRVGVAGCLISTVADLRRPCRTTVWWCTSTAP